MVEVSDFNLVLNAALENQLPYSVQGYIQSDCDSYVPPEGYVVTNCDYVGAKVVGGNSYQSLYLITVQEQSMVATQTYVMVGGLALVALVALGALYAKGATERATAAKKRKYNH